MLHIVVDAMGGDNAPASNVRGAVAALSKNQNIRITLTGDETRIREILNTEEYDRDRLEILHTTQVIETGDEPMISVRQKKDSSLVVGLKMLKQKEADAFVSAGSTGAVLVGSQFAAGRIPGVRRSPLVVEIPTLKGKSLLLDCGANVDAKPEWLLQWAVMGSVYAKNIMGIENPTVGLVNIGVEEEKGNALCRDTYPILKKCPQINFMGNAEARDLTYGVADVYVCDAFAGNIALKMLEGTAKSLMTLIKQALKSSTTGKIGGLMIKPSLKSLYKLFDASEGGGAPLLGLTGLVIKAHGNSDAKQITNAILQCVSFGEKDLTAQIEAAVKAL